MRRAFDCMLWLIFLYLISLLFFGFGGRATNCYGTGVPHSFIVLESPQGLEVLSENEFADMSSESMDQAFDEGIFLSSYATRDIGPWRGVFECTNETSYLPNPESLRFHHDEIINPQHRRAIYDAVVAYAQADPSLARYRPGQIPVYSFDTSDFVSESQRLLLVLGIPPILLFVFKKMVSLSDSSIYDQRRQRGVCIHCEYDCTDLPSSICPECGRLYNTALDQEMDSMRIGS